MEDIISWQQHKKVGLDIAAGDRLATHLYECSSQLFLGLQSGPTSEFDSAIIDSLRTQAQRFSLWGSSFNAHSGGLDDRLRDSNRLKHALLPMLVTLAETLILLARQLDERHGLAEAISLTRVVLAYVPSTSIANEVESTFMPISSLDDLSSSDSSDSDTSHPSESLELIADIRSCNDCLFGLGCVIDDSAESVPRDFEGWDPISGRPKYVMNTRKLVYHGEPDPPLRNRVFPLHWLDSTSTSSQSRSDFPLSSRSTAMSYSTELSSIVGEPPRQSLMASAIASGNSSQLGPSMYKQTNAEFQRFTEDPHATSRTRKVWICEDHSPDKKLLAHCRACTKGKKYGAFHIAVAHLRRFHSHTPEKGRRGQGIRRNKKGNDKASDDPMTQTLISLISWIKGVTEIVNLNDPVSEKHWDNEENGFQSTYFEDAEFPMPGSVNRLTSLEPGTPYSTETMMRTPVILQHRITSTINTNDSMDRESSEPLAEKNSAFRPCPIR